MASDAILTLSDSNFDEHVKSDQPVLVDFWATWCGPCRMLAPVIEEVASETQGKLVVGKLDVDENQATAQKFGVMSIPTLLVFKNGEVVKSLVGYMPKKDLLDKLADVL
ncbi:MAG: thioredoxin [Bacilli bacterium]|nr:thioredoxin [Bacilli bacterium]